MKVSAAENVSGNVSGTSIVRNLREKRTVVEGSSGVFSRMCHCVRFGNGGLYLVLCALFFAVVPRAVSAATLNSGNKAPGTKNKMQRMLTLVRDWCKGSFDYDEEPWRVRMATIIEPPAQAGGTGVSPRQNSHLTVANPLACARGSVVQNCRR